MEIRKTNKNANDIANRAGLLYDKFVGFIKNLDEIGDFCRKPTLHMKRQSVNSRWSGNLLGQVSKLQKLESEQMTTLLNSTKKSNRKHRLML